MRPTCSLHPWERGAHFRGEGIDILFYAFDETGDAGQNGQPFRIGANFLLLWDGRLDNREDLVRELGGAARTRDSDVAVVAAAYTRWGTSCIAKLVGDWALSVWECEKRELILAKDFLGTRPLFYSIDKSQVQWSSVLDPLVLSGGRRFPLDREYLAGWFGLFPAAHLTPYLGIHSVPPATYVVLRKDSVETKEFWRFEERQTLVYSCDGEYEGHFLHLFRQAVRRRLRSPLPVLAELSGGMDSSSIVCVADRILAEGGSVTPRLDTITYHSSIEPNWNELPYVEKVEALRGKTGYRIEVRSEDGFHFDFDSAHFMVTPGSLHSQSTSAREFSRVFAASGSYVLLSGIGGDEVLGGVPSPVSLLADLLKQGRLLALTQQLVSWGLALRRPLLSLLAETLTSFSKATGSARSVSPPPWLSKAFVRGYASAILGYSRRLRVFGPRPSFQENLNTLEALRRQLASFPLSPDPPYRKAYPYLDRDLLEFLFALPPDQLVRPNQRRSLMRRALAGILPQELLNRKRKAFVIRGPLAAIAARQAQLNTTTGPMLASSLGIIDPSSLDATLRDVHSGELVSIPAIVRTFAIERWLRNAAHYEVFDDQRVHVRPTSTEASASNREFPTSLS